MANLIASQKPWAPQLEARLRRYHVRNVRNLVLLDVELDGVVVKLPVCYIPRNTFGGLGSAGFADESIGGDIERKFIDRIKAGDITGDFIYSPLDLVAQLQYGPGSNIWEERDYRIVHQSIQDFLSTGESRDDETSVDDIEIEAERFSEDASYREQVTTELSSHLHESAATRLVEISRLEGDWDGYGGHPVNLYALMSCITLLGTVTPHNMTKLGEVFIAPLPDGGLELEWGQLGDLR